MSSTKKEGKDVVIFVTKEDHEKPSEVQLEEPEAEPGLILDNGDINWNCPCLGGMASGPCGVDFREAFSCFHYSVAEPKGSDCFQHFKTMQDCMVQYPNLYPSRDNDENELDEDEDPIPNLVSDQNSEQIAKDSIASSSKSK